MDIGLKTPEALNEARNLIDRAMACHRSGQVDQAESLYLGASQLVGDRSVVALPLGCLYLQTGKVEQAVEWLDEFVRRQPESVEGWIFDGHARLRSGHYAAAAYAYLRALARRADNPEIVSAYWSALDQAGGLNAAASEQQLLGAKPSLVDLHTTIFGSPPELVHPTFTQFPPRRDVVPPGFIATAYGSLIRKEFYGASVNVFTESAGLFTGPTAGGSTELPPSRNEEYFEWIDVLESIAAAKGRFTMVELGAGFGRWIVAAATVLRLYRDIPSQLIGVEAEDRHFEMMQQHFLDNGLDPANHRLIKAAVGEKNGEVHFMIGHSQDWWGQSIAAKDSRFRDFPEAHAVSVPCLSIESVLEGIDLVDLIDMDIQGAEAEAVRGSRDVLSGKVKRMHIGTHGRAIEYELFRLFADMGWVCCNNLPCHSTLETHYGSTSFNDGVQTWINPRLQHR